MTEITSITEVGQGTGAQDKISEGLREQMCPTQEAKNTVTFRGQEVTLKYPLYALMKLEERGVNIADVNSEQVKITDIVNIVWAGLVCQFPDVTVEEIATVYDMADMEQLAAAMSAAFNKVTGK